MPASDYVSQLRRQIGHDLVLLPGVAAAVFDHDGRLLLARRRAGTRWGFIGGGIEPFEEPLDAVRRELMQETGADGHVLGVVGSYGGRRLAKTHVNGDRVSYVTTVYACRLNSGVQWLDQAEVSQLGWFTRADISELARFEWIDDVVGDAFAWWAGHVALTPLSR
ncbi:MAG: NUDIX domain-containing protein [Cryobacterium sp.]